MRNLPEIKKIWKTIKESGGFHNFLLFLVFVVIATVFWLMMAMNDSVQTDFNVGIQIDNVPDSVIFIEDAPVTMHVTVRDQGTSLLRQGVMRKPTLHINFRDYAQNGEFRFTPSDMRASLKATFGKSASILSCSLDSIRIPYSTGKGKSVAVDIVSDIKAAPGNVLVGGLHVNPGRVKIFGPASILDTIHKVYTEKLVRRNVDESMTIGVSLRQIKGARIVPGQVEIKVKAEPLVRKEYVATIHPVNVPDGLNLVLFPSKVTIEFYVPMSRFGEENKPIEAFVDYSQVGTSRNGKLGIMLGQIPNDIVRPSLQTDSVEYSVVR